jgi:hypothetical protein
MQTSIQSAPSQVGGFSRLMRGLIWRLAGRVVLPDPIGEADNLGAAAGNRGR